MILLTVIKLFFFGCGFTLVSMPPKKRPAVGHGVRTSGVYLIHGNCGRPFRVSVQQNREKVQVQVFKSIQDDDDDEEEGAPNYEAACTSFGCGEGLCRAEHKAGRWL